MFIKQGLQWLKRVSPSMRRRPRGQGRGRRGVERYPLRVEPLEDRVLLSFTFADKLIPSSSLGNAGVSVAVEGNTAVVGAPGDNNLTGAAYVYTESNGVWSQQAKLVGTGAVGNGERGTSVALSGDGNTLAIGAPEDNSAKPGAVYVFTRSNGAWTQQAKLVATGSVGNSDEQGHSVALSGDGNTLVVGAIDDNNGAGAAYAFTRSNGAWTQQAKLIGTGAVGSFVEQGDSVSLSGDGNTLVVGSPGDKGGGLDAGATYVFTRSNGAWTQQAKLVGTGAVGTGLQGSSVSLSADGNTLAVGAPGDNPPNGVLAGAGATYLFTQSNGAWTQQAKLVGTGAVGTSAQQGFSVSLSGDGNTLVEGAPTDNSGAGAAYFFTRSNGAWTQQTKLAFTGVGSAGDKQGSSVALSSDGNTVLSGAPFNNNSAGAAYVFTNTGGGGGVGSSTCSCNSADVSSPLLSSVGFLGLMIEELELTLERIIDAVLLDLGMPDGSMGAGIDQLSTAISNDALFNPADFPGQLAVYWGQLLAANALGGV
jgi:hypothetical protein